MHAGLVGPRLRRVLVPIAVLAVAAIAVAWLTWTAPEPERRDEPTRGAPVEVWRASRSDEAIEVVAYGRVVAARSVILRSEVAGEIIWVSEELIPGGRVTEGDRLVQVDPRPYRLAVRSQRAAEAQARVELELERSRAEVAAEEWELLRNEGVEEAPERGRSLALREPQVEASEIALASARSDRERAALDLERTTIEAPFDAVVVEEAVDRGDVIGRESELAELVATDAAWVEVAIPVGRLGRIRIPTGPDEEGSSVRIRHVREEDVVVRSGHVLRARPSLEAEGTVARLLVVVVDPFRSDGRGRQLFLGAYVQARVDAGTLEGVIEIPRAALREGGHVWVANDDDALEIREVSVAWGREETVLIERGIADGERVIVSELAEALPGMEVRVAEERRPRPRDKRASSNGHERDVARARWRAR